MGVLGAGAMLVAYAFAEAGSPTLTYGMVGGAFLLAAAVGFHRRALKVAGTGLGVMLCLFILHDFRLHLWVRPESTDVGVLARALGRPDLVIPIVYAWTLVTFVAIAWAVWRVDRAGRRQAVACAAAAAPP